MRSPYWIALIDLAIRDKRWDQASQTLAEAEKKLGDRAALRLDRAALDSQRRERRRRTDPKLAEKSKDFSAQDQVGLWRGLVSASLAVDDVPQAERLCQLLMAQLPGDLSVRLELFTLAHDTNDVKLMDSALEEIGRVESSGPIWHYATALRLFSPYNEKPRCRSRGTGRQGQVQSPPPDKQRQAGPAPGPGSPCRGPAVAAQLVSGAASRGADLRRVTPGRRGLGQVSRGRPAGRKQPRSCPARPATCSTPRASMPRPMPCSANSKAKRCRSPPSFSASNPGFSAGCRTIRGPSKPRNRWQRLPRTIATTFGSRNFSASSASPTRPKKPCSRQVCSTKRPRRPGWPWSSSSSARARRTAPKRPWPADARKSPRPRPRSPWPRAWRSWARPTKQASSTPWH